MFIIPLIDHIIYVLLTMQVIFRDHTNKKNLKRPLNDIKCKYPKCLKLDRVGNYRNHIVLHFWIWRQATIWEHSGRISNADSAMNNTIQRVLSETLKIVCQGEGEDGEEYNSEGDLAETGEKYTWKESGHFCYLSLGIVW